MSVTKEVSIWCDGKSADNPCVQWTEGLSDSVATARKNIKKKGWTTKRALGGMFLDLCPRCSKSD